VKLPLETAVLSAGLTSLLQLYSQVDNLPRTRIALDDRSSNSGVGILVYYCTFRVHYLFFFLRDTLLSADPVMGLGFGNLIC